jgi:beta-glucosidase
VGTYTGKTLARRRVERYALAAALFLGAAYALVCFRFAAADAVVVFRAEELSAPLPRFPEGFLWGTATAAHQVEGGNTRNDWARWEEVPGKIARGEKSGRAVDHWNRVAEDVALMKDLGANAHRFSIEWSRLEPAEGSWDEEAFAHYADELRQLRKAGIVPMVTLLHFTLPAWLADRGGLVAPEFPERFRRFAAEAAKRLGPWVDLWCTINEPNVQAYLGYVEAVWPPGKTSRPEMVRAHAGLLRAHAAAASALRKADPGCRIGIALHTIVFDPAARWSLADWIATRAARESFNWAFHDAIVAGRVRFAAPGFPSVDEPLPELAGSVDYLGINYYTRNIVRFAPGAPALVRLTEGPGPRTDKGWEIYPEGLLRVLRQAYARYHLPIQVTENGIADAAGTKRSAYIRGHAYAVSRAIAEGIPVGGYFYWSLTDNFEWAEGFAPRFGLYRVDYPSLERTLAPGAEAFTELARVSAGGRRASR